MDSQSGWRTTWSVQRAEWVLQVPDIHLFIRSPSQGSLWCRLEVEITTCCRKSITSLPLSILPSPFSASFLILFSLSSLPADKSTQPWTSRLTTSPLTPSPGASTARTVVPPSPYKYPSPLIQHPPTLSPSHSSHLSYSPASTLVSSSVTSRSCGNPQYLFARVRPSYPTHPHLSLPPLPIHHNSATQQTLMRSPSYPLLYEFILLLQNI